MKAKTLTVLLLAAAAATSRGQGPDAGALTLADTVREVIAHHPTIESAQAAVDEARARTTEAGSARLPQVSGQASYAYNSLRPYVAINIPGGPSGAIYESITDSYTATVTARQLLTDFGRTDKLVEMSRSGLLAAQDALEAAQHQLGYQAIGSFYGVILLRSSVDVAREEIVALEEALRISEKKYSAGSATKFDVLTTEVRLLNARNHLTDTSAQLEKEENGLRELLGLGPTDPLRLAGDFDATAPVAPESDSISQGLERRPEMRVARDDERTARLKLDATDRESRPTLQAQVTGGVQDQFVPNLYDNKSYVAAGLSLQVPIFTGRRISGERLEAGAGVRSAESREKELSRSITDEIADAYADLGAAGERLSRAALIVDQAKEALTLAKTRYANGVITNFELLDAQSSLRAAQLSRLQARYDRVVARQAIARAAGSEPGP
jgi:outer membrane protein TolC